MSSPHEALSISERISEAIQFKEVFHITAFGTRIPITETVVTTWVVMAILIGFSLLVTRRLKLVPRGLQSIVEFFVDFAGNFTTEYIGHHGKNFAPFIGTLVLFLGTANLLPLLTPIGASFGGHVFEPAFVIKPLTRDINVTAAFAIITMTVVIFSNFRYHGPIGFLKTLVKPLPMMLPFNLLEYLVKPLSLALRLFGNITAAFIIMQLIEAIMPVGLPPIMALYFDLFDGLIQAVVFSFLSTVYIAEAIE